MANEKPVKKAGRKAKTKMLGNFLKGSYLLFGAGIVFTFLISFMDTLNPQIVSAVVDGVIGDGAENVPDVVEKLIQLFGGYDNLKANMILTAAMVVSVAFVSAVSYFANRYFITNASETLMKNMRDKIFSHIQRLPYSWHMKNRTGDIIQRCTSDADNIRNFITEQLISLFRIIVMLVLSIYYMYSMNLTLAIISTSFIPFILLYCIAFRSKVGKRFREADEAESELSTMIQENLTGVRVVRAFGREREERDKFITFNNKFAGMWMKLNKLFTFFWSSTDGIGYLQNVVVVTVGTLLCIQGKISSGNLIAFISYNVMLIGPIRQLGRMLAELSKADVSLDRIQEIMAAEEEKDKPDAVELDKIGDISFNHVSYGYDERVVLDDVSFTIKEGQTIGILGGTGSGKTTIISLLGRLYDLAPECGSITINGGTDIRDVKASWLRKNIGIVMQEPYLFSSTLGGNIAISKNEASEDEIRTAARIASLDETIEQFKDKYETFVGERGVTLSGGQKQRVAIARAVLAGTQVIVFDDALSAVDTQTDAKIRKELAVRFSDATVILVSHRITTLMNADNIIVLDKGKIVEQGTHDELVEKDGLYNTIYKIQKSGSEVE